MQMVMKNSAEGLTLEVDRVNETAYHLYKNLGFEEGLRKTAVLVKC